MSFFNDHLFIFFMIANLFIDFRYDLLHPANDEAKDMIVATKDILVFPELCSSDKCSGRYVVHYNQL